MMRVIDFSPEMEPLGPVVVAMGVFDGVHLGHAALVAEAAAEAASFDVPAVVLTFDRDPDQVVSPDSAAPQLLALADKCAFLIEAGADIVLVVPFTAELAALSAESFLDDILSTACEPLAVHVGHDFRFGARAASDVRTLEEWGARTATAIHAHDLVSVEGEPITSTRIRALVAQGRVGEAAVLLGRSHRVRGVVVHGRGTGTEVAVATANVAVGRYDALPADGVYAGRAVTSDGSVWPAGISVGVPPTFPQATDVLEAHLIGYDGSLYDVTLILEFIQRLREQRAFPTTDSLKAAIAEDLQRVIELVPADAGVADIPAEDDEYIDDPEALAAAERRVASLVEADPYADFDDTWVDVSGPIRLASLVSDGGAAAFSFTTPLQMAEIPFAWDPMPPEHVAQARPDFSWQRTFRLFVPPEYAEEARMLLGGSEDGTVEPGPTRE